MNTIKINQHPEIKQKIKSYPKEIQEKILYLRSLIIETASEIESISEIEETLKWGELSYIAKNGSTIRIDWKPAKDSNQYAMYFHCKTSLVSTFKTVYGNLFKYEKNRAILFDKQDKIPVNELKECIEMALKYHTLKNKPFLGK